MVLHYQEKSRQRADAKSFDILVKEAYHIISSIKDPLYGGSLTESGQIESLEIYKLPEEGTELVLILKVPVHSRTLYTFIEEKLKTEFLSLNKRIRIKVDYIDSKSRVERHQDRAEETAETISQVSEKNSGRKNWFTELLSFLSLKTDGAGSEKKRRSEQKKIEQTTSNSLLDKKDIKPTSTISNSGETGSNNSDRTISKRATSETPSGAGGRKDSAPTLSTGKKVNSQIVFSGKRSSGFTSPAKPSGIRTDPTKRVASKKIEKGLIPIANPRPQHILMVASGKGGVGKSTLSLLLAKAFVQKGLKTGLLDADIYGPSQTVLTGLKGPSEIVERGEHILLKPGLIPVLPKADSQKQDQTMDRKNLGKREMTNSTTESLKVMSMGLLMREGAPAAMRGPMAQGAIRKMWRGTDWGALDLLVIDTPPGTGDIILAIIQEIIPEAALMVTTPPLISRSDVQRLQALLEKVRMPVLGTIENMSFYSCPCCGEASEPFAREEGEENTEFLAKLPIFSNLYSEKGHTLSEPGEISQLAEQILQKLWALAPARAQS